MGQRFKEGLESAAPPTFEQGPIRPPSEARSLLVRVTRNCPWNKCEFCPVYKGQKFSRRTVDEVKSDIRAMAWWREKAVEESWSAGYSGVLDVRTIPAVYKANHDNPYMQSILIWMYGGAKTAFLQDADNLILKSDDLAEMLKFLRETFPGIERVTTYSRSRTINKREVEELVKLKQAGLDRVHVGMESGSDKVLEMVKKGVTAEIHIAAAKKVKDAGLELSHYIMPGLGGRALSDDHARETARVLNESNPHFIRIRSLGLREGMPLHKLVEEGEFEIMNDVEIARELRLTVGLLEGIESTIVSDHILNLLPEVEGKLPEDREKILAVIDGFLEMSEEDQATYVVGRRFGLFEALGDMGDPTRKQAATSALARIREQGGEDIHATIREIVSRFI